MQLVQVSAIKNHMRGTMVSGVAGGRQYVVNKETGQLHATQDGAVFPTPGCHPDDAAEFRQFPSDFKTAIAAVPGGKRSAPPAPPAPPAKKAVAAPVVEIEDPEEEAEEPAIPWPAESDSVTKWLTIANAHGITASSAERSLHKAELIALLKSKAAK